MAVAQKSRAGSIVSGATGSRAGKASEMVRRRRWELRRRRGEKCVCVCVCGCGAVGWCRVKAQLCSDVHLRSSRVHRRNYCFTHRVVLSIIHTMHNKRIQYLVSTNVKPIGTSHSRLSARGMQPTPAILRPPHTAQCALLPSCPTTHQLDRSVRLARRLSQAFVQLRQRLSSHCTSVLTPANARCLLGSCVQ